jgi:hypothetical protein
MKNAVYTNLATEIVTLHGRKAADNAMFSERTLTLIIRLLEECLENEYSAEELRGKIRDVLKLLIGNNSSLDGRHLRGGAHL